MCKFSVKGWTGASARFCMNWSDLADRFYYSTSFQKVVIIIILMKKQQKSTAICFQGCHLTCRNSERFRLGTNEVSNVICVLCDTGGRFPRLGFHADLKHFLWQPGWVLGKARCQPLQSGSEESVFHLNSVWSLSPPRFASFGEHQESTIMSSLIYQAGEFMPYSILLHKC